MRRLSWLLLLLTTLCHADENVELLICPDQIESKIQTAAKSLNELYRNDEVVIVMVMKGAICVTADLIRHLDVPFTIDYLKASSYGQHGTTAGELKVSGLDALDIEGKHVLVVDDIFDTGNTMVTLMSLIQQKSPKSLKSLVLLVKDVPRKVTYRPDFVLFDIPNRFVIGYGLDYKEHYRGLPGIFAFINDTPPLE
ncbi:MAG: hypoxanthine phosphoribosyltransferase [Verrucomicrobia bacterium]|nr:hypoxanthine phosphoribosyltransferase [Verrucomicrobiota bacterium]